MTMFDTFLWTRVSFSSRQGGHGAKLSLELAPAWPSRAAWPAPPVACRCMALPPFPRSFATNVQQQLACIPLPTPRPAASRRTQHQRPSMPGAVSCPPACHHSLPPFTALTVAVRSCCNNNDNNNNSSPARRTPATCRARGPLNSTLAHPPCSPTAPPPAAGTR